MNKSTSVAARAGLLAATVVLVGSAYGAAAQRNTTGLPTYPHDKGGTMDEVMRSIPNGQHCMHYAGSSKDALATVIEWYKTALPGATSEDVNLHSLYGSYFKLDGVKLMVGNDFVNVYRLPSTDKSAPEETSIEIFKCKDAPQAARE